ncbi:hypothetical protein MRX96_044280 [Rhipicephalus microplus]
MQDDDDHDEESDTTTSSHEVPDEDGAKVTLARQRARTTAQGDAQIRAFLFLDQLHFLPTEARHGQKEVAHCFRAALPQRRRRAPIAHVLRVVPAAGAGHRPARQARRVVRITAGIERASVQRDLPPSLSLLHPPPPKPYPLSEETCLSTTPFNLPSFFHGVHSPENAMWKRFGEGGCRTRRHQRHGDQWLDGDDGRRHTRCRGAAIVRVAESRRRAAYGWKSRGKMTPARRHAPAWHTTSSPKVASGRGEKKWL